MFQTRLHCLGLILLGFLIGGSASWLLLKPTETSDLSHCKSVECLRKTNTLYASVTPNNQNMFINRFTARRYQTIVTPEVQKLWAPLVKQSDRNVKRYIQTQPQHKTCAVVGNGAKLTGKGFGTSIDAHEAVFRMTFAKVKGYEKDVGKRTSYRVQWTYRKIAEYDDPVIIIYHYNTKSTLPFVMLRWISYFAAGFNGMPKEEVDKYAFDPPIRPTILRHVPKDRFLVVDGAFVEDVNRQWYEADGHYLGIGGGMLTLAMALHMCEKVDVYGFTTSEKDDLCYYYDRGEATCRLKERFKELEPQTLTLKKMQQAGRITIFE